MRMMLTGSFRSLRFVLSVCRHSSPRFGTDVSPRHSAERRVDSIGGSVSPIHADANVLVEAFSDIPLYPSSESFASVGLFRWHAPGYHPRAVLERFATGRYCVYSYPAVCRIGLARLRAS